VLSIFNFEKQHANIKDDEMHSKARVINVLCIIYMILACNAGAAELIMTILHYLLVWKCRSAVPACNKSYMH
jgi:hypothetical protein